MPGTSTVPRLHFPYDQYGATDPRAMPRKETVAHNRLLALAGGASSCSLLNSSFGKQQRLAGFQTGLPKVLGLVLNQDQTLEIL